LESEIVLLNEKNIEANYQLNQDIIGRDNKILDLETNANQYKDTLISMETKLIFEVEIAQKLNG
jgi:hypothetical protein